MGQDRFKRQSQQTPQGTLTYAYDDGGNLLMTRSSNTNGASVDYTYDAMNRLASVKDNALPAGANTTTYAYDDVGNLQNYRYPNGVTTSYGYNSLNRLTNLAIGAGPTSLAGFTYTLGPTGNRLSVAEQNGHTVNYTYDSLYRLTNETISGASVPSQNGSISYSYDPIGNRLSRTSSIATVPSTTNTYDDNDRLTSDSYDNNGNTITSSGAAYGYNFENRLTSVNGGVISFVYDGDGNRVAKTVNGVTTRYLVDSNNPTGYPQVVDEITGNQIARSYTYGHSLISQKQFINNQWQLSFYGYDGQGSVRLLTGITGAITDTYTYDAFGNLLGATGHTPNEHLYAGEQFDANVGFYYLRARYLNPSSGRFWTMDSYEGSSADPASLHKYLYVGADPINKVDPSGQDFADVMGTLAGIGIISAMSVIRFIGIGIAVTESACILDMIGTAILREEGFDVGGLTPCSKDKSPRITLYRGVNQNHAGYPEALLGIAKPNRRWWQFWKLSPLTPFEHNTIQEATINSVFTSWTLNPLVAEAYALRDQLIPDTISMGVVLEAQIPISRTFPSPDLFSVRHPISNLDFPEQEVLVRGVIRGAKVRMEP